MAVLEKHWLFTAYGLLKVLLITIVNDVTSESSSAEEKTPRWNWMRISGGQSMNGKQDERVRWKTRRLYRINTRLTTVHLKLRTRWELLGCIGWCDSSLS